MGILDPDSGEYTDTGKGVHPVFQGSIIDPANLPTKKVDPYASVEHRDFSMVNTMGVKEMIQMGAIAESRGDSTTAMRWKTLANDLIIREQVRDGQSTATRQAENRYVSPPGSGIVEPKLQTPWDSDPEYQDVQRQLSKAQSVEGWADDAETRTKVAALQSSLRIREQGARQDAIDNGTWSVADDNILAANRSLHEKAAAVAAQVKSS